MLSRTGFPGKRRARPHPEVALLLKNRYEPIMTGTAYSKRELRGARSWVRFVLNHAISQTAAKIIHRTETIEEVSIISYSSTEF
jgi:hypothetical protein